jgi:hypothetical protein
VRIPVPSVDRAKVDHRNFWLFCVKKMGCINWELQGMLPQRFVRNQFEPTASNFLKNDIFRDSRKRSGILSGNGGVERKRSKSTNDAKVCGVGYFYHPTVLLSTANLI